ncbi:hypothetical protein C9E85_14720 [Plesiomonas shigelloides]|uniref:helix-turn-helix domain-containing protein n=1 Tax=Plesiomonas shigelloides TaxID=703 RepID=UPI000D568D47|nr:hypothetical protein C9E85_14720 [Plesiomonas shigelloides]
MARPRIYNDEIRAQVVKARQQGATIQEIADHFGMSLYTVRQINKQAQAEKPKFDFSTITGNE